MRQKHQLCLTISRQLCVPKPSSAGWDTAGGEPHGFDWIVWRKERKTARLQVADWLLAVCHNVVRGCALFSVWRRRQEQSQRHSRPLPWPPELFNREHSACCHSSLPSPHTHTLYLRHHNLSVSPHFSLSPPFPHFSLYSFIFVLRQAKHSSLPTW